VVQHGLEERRTPGNTLAVQPDKPYQGLSMFGTGEPRGGGLVCTLGSIMCTPQPLEVPTTSPTWAMP